jgi:hypothetical protein
MPKYEVNCYRKVTDMLRTTVTVEAANEREARERAIEAAIEQDDFAYAYSIDAGPVFIPTVEIDDEIPVRSIAPVKMVCSTCGIRRRDESAVVTS